MHWLCDLVWLEILSQASFRGTRVFGERSQRIVTTICALALLVLGTMFVWDAVEAFLRSA